MGKDSFIPTDSDPDDGSSSFLDHGDLDNDTRGAWKGGWAEPDADFEDYDLPDDLEVLLRDIQAKAREYPDDAPRKPPSKTAARVDPPPGPALPETPTPLDPTAPLQVTLATSSPDYLEPWNRQPDESDIDWERFTFFCSLPPSKRTVPRVADHFKVHPSRIKQQMTKHNWRVRVAQLDQHNERLYQFARQEQIRKMAKRHVKKLGRVIDAMMLPVMALERRLERDPDAIEHLENLSMAKLMTLATRTSRLVPSMMATQRLAVGMPTQIVEHDAEVVVRSEFSRDQLVEIAVALERAGSLDVGGGSGQSQAVYDAEIVEILPDDADSETGGLPPS